MARLGLEGDVSMSNMEIIQTAPKWFCPIHFGHNSFVNISLHANLELTGVYCLLCLVTKATEAGWLTRMTEITPIGQKESP